MTGIVLLAHGSREGDTERTMRQITDAVKAALHSDMIEEAYLQFREKNLERGLLSLIGRGADTIKIIPYFLFEGVHIKEDIPAEIRQFNEAYPHVRIVLGRTLGADSRLADILVERIGELS